MQDEAKLMVAIAASDDESLRTLILRYRRLVHRVAVDILRDPAEAEDVTQEVFLELYRKAHLYDASRGSVRVWVLQYAYHRSLRRKTALRRRAAYRSEPLDALVDLASRPQRRLSREECRWVIHAGLAQLPSSQRLTVQLTCFEDLNLREIADRMGVSLGCARHYYYRGLARLRAWADQAPAHPSLRPHQRGRELRRPTMSPGSATRVYHPHGGHPKPGRPRRASVPRGSPALRERSAS